MLGQKSSHPHRHPSQRSYVFSKTNVVFYCEELAFGAWNIFLDPPQLGQILGLLGQLRVSETVHSEPRAKNKVCHGGRTRVEFDQVQGVTLESKTLKQWTWISASLRKGSKGHLQTKAKPENGVSNGNFFRLMAQMATPRIHLSKTCLALRSTLIKTKASYLLVTLFKRVLVGHLRRRRPLQVQPTHSFFPGKEMSETH